jgi:hypothetical protein
MADFGEAIFFEGKNYEGTAHPYPISGEDQATCSGDSLALNDKYLSVQVGQGVKVLAWQHCDGSGKYREWTEDIPDLSDIGGLSRFKVVGNSDSTIAFRLVDRSGAEIPLSLKLQAYAIGESTDRSDDNNDEYHIIGHVPTDQAGGEPFVTQVSLRKEVWPGEYLSLGSVYFNWNDSDKKVDLTYTDNKPAGFEFEQTGVGTFDFIWGGL